MAFGEGKPQDPPTDEDYAMGRARHDCPLCGAKSDEFCKPIGDRPKPASGSMHEERWRLWKRSADNVTRPSRRARLLEQLRKIDEEETLGRLADDGTTCRR